MIRAVALTVSCILGFGVWQNLGPGGSSVRQVRVEGARLLTEAALHMITDQAIGRPMSARTRDDLRGRLESHWLVHRAEVTRRWPWSMRVRLVERRIIARSDGEPPVAIDGTGEVLPVEGVPEMLPTLQGWTRQDSDAWGPSLSAIESLAAVAELWVGSTVEAPPHDGCIAVRCPAAGIRVQLPCPADEGLTQRVLYVPTIVADVRARGKAPALVDLRWANQIVVAEIER